MKKHLAILILTACILLISTACESTEGEDTRQYIDAFGVVFTNDADDVINELYVFPISIDGTDVLEQDMGHDLIKNTGNIRRIGSFGVTIDTIYSSYNVMARGRQQNIYVFEGVPLSNVCEAVLSHEHKDAGGAPLLTIFHRNGAVDVIHGEYLVPGDAPNHAHVPLRKTTTVRFNVANNTENEITFISMREADNPGKGEVELFIGALEASKSTSINYRLFEEDEEITRWLLYIETANGDSIQFEEIFNPWETSRLEFSEYNGILTLTIS